MKPPSTNTTGLPISAQHAILPFEMQLKILEWLAESHRSLNESKPRLSVYACVCKGWQAIVEEELFRHLTLHLSDIYSFAHYACPHRRGYIKHILLETYIQDYHDKDPLDPNMTDRENCNTLTLAVCRLWQVLSTWTNHRLTVELGVVSSFEKKNASVCDGGVYQPMLTSLAQPPLETDPTIPHMDHLATFHHPPNDHPSIVGWIYQKMGLLGHQPVELNLNLNSSLEKDPQGTPCLPKVEVIAKLLIRRRYFRNTGPQSLGQIFASTPRIEVVHLERWCSVTGDIIWQYDSAKLVHTLSPSLKRLSFFQDYNTAYHRLVGADLWRSNKVLLNSLTKISHHLEHISISFAIDATHFFSSRQQLDFGLLTTMALTSRVMTSRSAIRVSELLSNAARAVKRMPKLKLLEVWNYSAGETGIFVYEKLDRRSQITWQGTWDFKIPEEIENTWREVSNDSHGDLYELGVKNVTLEIDQLTSLRTIFPYLRLREHILHEVSWTQV